MTRLKAILAGIVAGLMLAFGVACTGLQANAAAAPSPTPTLRTRVPATARPVATARRNATATRRPTATRGPSATPRPTATRTPAAVRAGFNPAKAGTVERDITYCTAGGVALKLDVYYPPSTGGPAPGVVYVHGGGWTSGDKTEGASMRALVDLSARGFLVFSVDYRLAPRYPFPAQIQDVKCAVRYLRANAARYGLDPDHLAAWGNSAGGHLVSLLGTAGPEAGWDAGPYRYQSSRVQAVVDMFGPVDLTRDFVGEASARIGQQVFGALTAGDPVLSAASPVSYITPDDPPFLILHGAIDPLVPVSQSQAFHEQLVAAGVPASLVVVENAGHGFPDVPEMHPSQAELADLITAFLNEQLR